MRVVVLGKSGMLGRYVYTYLKRIFDVIGTNRADLDALSIVSPHSLSLYFNSGDIVINCIGIIPQRGSNNTLNFIYVNSLFPHFLQEACVLRDAKLISVSTDCVFSGRDGYYNENSQPDAVDIYGRTKSLGEPVDATIIRTSFIGEELKNKVSLIEWVKQNRGGIIGGYTNHYWNGITCLQFAKVCEYIIKENLFWKGVKHVFSPTLLTKCSLIESISEAFGLGISVEPVSNQEPCNRVLTTVKTDIKIPIPNLRSQIKDLAVFSTTLNKQTV